MDASTSATMPKIVNMRAAVRTCQTSTLESR
jgi:hypothetical protein